MTTALDGLQFDPGCAELSTRPDYDDALRRLRAEAPSPAHLAFGFGEHLCLGASLARLEGRVFPGHTSLPAVMA